MKKFAAIAFAGLVLAGCGSPIPDSEPVVHGAPVLVETTTGPGSLGPFLESYAPEVFEPSAIEAYLDRYVPEGE